MKIINYEDYLILSEKKDTSLIVNKKFSEIKEFINYCYFKNFSLEKEKYHEYSINFQVTWKDDDVYYRDLNIDVDVEEEIIDVVNYELYDFIEANEKYFEEEKFINLECNYVLIDDIMVRKNPIILKNSDIEDEIFVEKLKNIIEKINNTLYSMYGITEIHLLHILESSGEEMIKKLENIQEKNDLSDNNDVEDFKYFWITNHIESKFKDMDINKEIKNKLIKRWIDDDASIKDDLKTKPMKQEIRNIIADMEKNKKDFILLFQKEVMKPIEDIIETSIKNYCSSIKKMSDTIPEKIINNIEEILLSNNMTKILNNFDILLKNISNVNMFDKLLFKNNVYLYDNEVYKNNFFINNNINKIIT